MKAAERLGRSGHSRAMIAAIALLSMPPERYAERDIGHQPQTHRFLEQFAKRAARSGSDRRAARCSDRERPSAAAC
jgi:hypothetical protein